ncbi:MAG: replicative DNA helicase [Pseudomonadota bacterium]
MKRQEEPRTPPHSLEAEQALLGGLLLENAAWDRIGGAIAGTDFYRFEHRLVFDALASLINANRPADVLTVHEELKRLDKDEESGGLPYLNALAQSVPSAANIRRYAEIVRENAEQRALIAAVGSGHEIAWSADGSPVEKRDRIAALLDAVGATSCGKEPRTMAELVVERLGHFEALSEGQTVPGIPTRIGSVDRALGGGLKPGKLIVLGARPTVGKTSLAGQIAAAVAAQGHPVLVLSQEMTAGELVDRFIANVGAVHLGGLTTGELGDDDWGRLSEAAEHLSRLPILIDDTPALTLQQVRAKARQVRRKHGLSLIVVDYLQLCSAPDGTERRHHQIEQISRGLKALAKEVDVAVLLLSQLNRASLDRAGGEPELSDLKESGAIEEDADVVMLLHPAGNEAGGALLMLLKIAKNRQGRRGRLALSFDGRVQRWAESAADVSRRGAA